MDHVPVDAALRAISSTWHCQAARQGRASIGGSRRAPASGAP